MKKKYIIIISAVVVILGLTVIMTSQGQLKYTVLQDDDFTVEFYRESDFIKPGNYEKISTVLDITEEKAVQIADSVFAGKTGDSYEVYYDEANEWYFVTAEYVTRDDRFDYFMTKLTGGYWENACVILIDKNSGAILNLEYLIY